jgi:signal transduction histidine kinase
MAGAIAHNFNNMLSVVLGNLELALDMSEDKADMTSHVQGALKAAWKASEISISMLTYLGQTAGEKEPVDLSSVCNHAFHILQLAKPAEIVVNTDFPVPGPFVRANAQQMQQVVSGLVANAWESMEGEQGTVDVSICTMWPEKIPSMNRFPIDWSPKAQEYACITVQDNGSGISDTDIEKIFDPFFTSKFTGRGMGLAVVLGILRSHDGGVTVESKQHKGSVFRVFIPLCFS